MNISEPCLEGFLLSFGLIIAIGPQNLFILKQGILAHHTFAAAFTCTCCDLFLISMGAMGLGSFIVHIEPLRESAIWGGAIFLIYYGVRSWIGVFKGDLTIQRQLDVTSPPEKLKAVILAALGFSFFNPQAFLDTIVLIGGISSRFDNLYDRSLFAFGSVTASTVWFFGLSYGARLLRPLFRKKLTAITFELMSGGVMLSIAWGLLQPEMVVNEEDEVVDNAVSFLETRLSELKGVSIEKSTVA